MTDCCTTPPNISFRQVGLIGLPACFAVPLAEKPSHSVMVRLPMNRGQHCVWLTVGLRMMEMAEVAWLTIVCACVCVCMGERERGGGGEGAEGVRVWYKFKWVFESARGRGERGRRGGACQA